jgi:IS30 family transposase
MLPVLFPRDVRMRPSDETIYPSLFVQTKGERKSELTPSAHPAAPPQTPDRRRQARHAGITDEIRTSQRPAEAEDRAVPGHWEGDLLLGGVGKGAVINLVEGSSLRFTVGVMSQDMGDSSVSGHR